MERALSNETANRVRFVEVTPSLLREAADRLEQSAKYAQHGEEVALRFTSSVTLRFQPEITSPAATGVLNRETAAEIGAPLN
jgi:ribosome-associated translation inhibitor RaiA